MEYKETFDKEFLQRTECIIQNSGLVKYNVTLLLNCALALICLPIERNKDKSLCKDLCAKLDDLQVQITETEPPTPPLFKLKCLRNGIAHIKMTDINENHKIVGVSITGGTKDKKTNIEHKCTFVFTVSQLKEFAIYMVKKYLEHSQ